MSLLNLLFSCPFFALSSCIFVLLSGMSCAAEQNDIEVAFPNLHFTRPVDLQSPKDDSNRLFVVEQAGLIKVFENRRDVRTSSTFLDIRERVRDNGNEEGLLGLAFHPQSKENGYFFVDYTASDPRRTVIARYAIDPADPRLADPDSEKIILEIDQPYANHNGGQIAFGPDGYLYIAMGDGGSAGDPFGNGQNTTTLLGNILRIDVDSNHENMPYGIPEDNPFVDQPEQFRPEIYAYGLRNPWRFSFDSVTGDLWAGDVGQNDFEEVDVIQKGGNYGWNIREAAHCYPPSSTCSTEGLIDPVAEYGRNEGGSITGGFVYRGSKIPEYAGKYIYADYVSGRIWALTFTQGAVIENVEITNTNLRISSFGVDRNNELYICAFDGLIYTLKRPA